MKYLAFLFCMIGAFIPDADAYIKIMDGEWHEVSVRHGEGILSLLARYELSGDKRLEDKFYALNQLSPSSVMYRHKKYKLPIYLYNYNGKSIRSTIGINDWEKAVRIKKYNELLLKKGVRSTHYTRSNILWVKSVELDLGKNEKPTLHEAEITPIAHHSDNKEVRSIKDNLFGHKYATVEIIDHSLKNKVYYIVSGHGGPDPGAICTECATKLCEDEYAYDVSLRLARNLRQHGAQVEMVIQDKNDGIRDKKILSCDGSERLANGAKLPKSQLSRLQQRTEYINKKYKEYKKKGFQDQVVLSLHIDSNSKSHKQDVFFCYFKESQASKKLAIQLRDKFQEKYNIHQKNRGYKGYLHQRNFYVLRKTAPPAVLIELANIRNKFNHKRILQKDNRQALANWIYEGLADRTRKIENKLLASSN